MEGWRIRSNNELQKLIKGEAVVKHKVTLRIKWWGLLNGMDVIKLVKETADWSIKSNKRTNKD